MVQWLEWASKVVSLVFSTQVVRLKTAFNFSSRGFSTSGLHEQLLLGAQTQHI